MNSLEAVLLGEHFEDDIIVWEPILYQNKPVLMPEQIKEYFGVTEFPELVADRDYIVLSGAELRAFLKENKIRKNVRSMYIYTMPGVIRLLAKTDCNSSGIDLIVTALNLTYKRLSDVSQLRLAFSTFCSVYEADKLFTESRINKLERGSNLPAVTDNSLVVPGDGDEIIAIDSTPVWVDKSGFFHVNQINRHVIGFYAMAEVAANLNLYSVTMNPHVQLVEDICRTALKIPRGAESPDGELWQTFKYCHYDSGVKHKKNCLRITEEGMNQVRDWWFRHASEFAFEEKERHGYHFSKKFEIHPGIPIMRPYSDSVNPVVKNINDGSVIDAQIIEQKFDEQGRPDYTDLPFYDSRDQNPDGTWKE